MTFIDNLVKVAESPHAFNDRPRYVRFPGPLQKAMRWVAAAIVLAIIPVKMFVAGPAYKTVFVVASALAALFLGGVSLAMRTIRNGRWEEGSWMLNHITFHVTLVFGILYA